MPYATNRQLPASVREHLPPEAQDIFRKAFNHAFGSNRGDHVAASRIAWAAVKQHYEQIGSEWRLKPNAQARAHLFHGWEEQRRNRRRAHRGGRLHDRHR